MGLLSSKLTRQKDATLVNQIANDPSIYPWVHGPIEGPLDLSPIIADERNVALFSSEGGLLFHHIQDGFYEVHTTVLPSSRGLGTLEIVYDALHWMFTRTSAVEIVTRVPKGNFAARALTRSIGGVLEFRNPCGWIMDKEPVFADLFSMKIQDWIRIAPGLDEDGQRVLSALGDEENRDSCIDRHIAASMHMMMGGQPQKGVIFFNRWAHMAGYSPIEIVTMKPLVVDFRSALVCVRDDDFWVI